MKTVDQVWRLYLEKGEKIDESSLRELSWHIENDEHIGYAISMAADMIVESQSPLMKRVLIPAMADQLHSEDSSTREFAVGAIRRLFLPQCGQDLYNIAYADNDKFVRILATQALGDIMDKVDKKLAHKMAIYLHDVLTNKDFEKYNKNNRDSASDSVLSAMGYNCHAFPRAWNDPDFDPIWKKFLKKYKLDDKPVFRR